MGLRATKSLSPRTLSLSLSSDIRRSSILGWTTARKSAATWGQRRPRGKRCPEIPDVAFSRVKLKARNVDSPSDWFRFSSCIERTVLSVFFRSSNKTAERSQIVQNPTALVQTQFELARARTRLLSPCADHSLQFSSRPPWSRTFWLDAAKSTRSAARRRLSLSHQLR